MSAMLFYPSHAWDGAALEPRGSALSHTCVLSWTRPPFSIPPTSTVCSGCVSQDLARWPSGEGQCLSSCHAHPRAVQTG